MKIKRRIAYKNITFCCQDCGTRIASETALRGQGRCISCSRKDKLHPMFGRKHSKESRLKMSKSKKGKKNNNYGKKFSKEHCLKISNALKGKILSKETRLKIGKTLKGKPLSKETCKKMSESRTGKKHPNWLGGISFFPYSIQFTKKLKAKIRCRDNHACQNCGVTEKEHIKKYNYILSIHHIDYNKQNCKPTNLITVCTGCNAKANFNRDYWFAYYTYIIQHFVSKNG